MLEPAPNFGGYEPTNVFSRPGSEAPELRKNLVRQLEEVASFIPATPAKRAAKVHGKKRFTEVLHNYCQEPLPWYKKLEHTRPEWPSDMKRYTSKDGFRVNDTHTMAVSAKDVLQRTKHGQLRTSSGIVTYNAVEATHLALDAEDLAKILREQMPQVRSGRIWSVKNLEKAYKMRFREHGSWERQGMSLKVYLELFPKTFDLFGANNDFVRVVSKSRQCAVDTGQDAMISLARACEQGFVDRHDPLEGTMKDGMLDTRMKLPALRNVKTKTLMRASSDPGLVSHTMPAIREKQELLNASFKLPRLKANTLPPFQNTPGRGSSLASTLRIDDDARSTFRISFSKDGSRRNSTTSICWDADPDSRLPSKASRSPSKTE